LQWSEWTYVAHSKNLPLARVEMFFQGKLELLLVGRKGSNFRSQLKLLAREPDGFLEAI
jgi:hypothetical protein